MRLFTAILILTLTLAVHAFSDTHTVTVNLTAEQEQLIQLDLKAINAQRKAESLEPMTIAQWLASHMWTRLEPVLVGLGNAAVQRHAEKIKATISAEIVKELAKEDAIEIEKP